MKKSSILVKKVLMSIATAGIFTFGFTACSDEFDELGTDGTPQAAHTELLEAYGLTFENFIADNDVIILDADTTKLSISKAYADKMGIASFVNHPMGIWHKMENLPYMRKGTAQQLVGDRYIVDVVPATVAELMGDKKVNLQTDIYVNPDAGSVKTRAAAGNIPEYAAKYVDDKDVIHPAAILLTDTYGYDKDIYFSDDQPSASQTRAAQTGEYQYITAEELAGGQTRWGIRKRLLAFDNSFTKSFDLAAKNSKDTVSMELSTKVDFELNFFLTLEGGISWGGPYVEKFETGVDGHFNLEAGVEFKFEKKWSLEDKLKFNIATIPGYTFTFFVGPIPVPIKISPNIFTKIDGEVSGKVSTGFKYTYGNEFMGGARYTPNNKWEGIGYFEETANDFEIYPAEVAFNLKTGVGLYLGADILIFNCAGPEFAVGPRLGGELEAIGKPFEYKDDLSDLYEFNGKVELSINAVLGAKLKVLGYEIAEQEVIIPMAGPWTLAKYPSDGSEHKVGDTDGVKTASKTVTEWPNFYKNLANSPYGKGFNDMMQSAISMLKEMNSCDDAAARQMIIKAIQKGYNNEPEATMVTFKNVSEALTGYYNEVNQQYKEYQYQKAGERGDTDFLNAMNWNDIIEELIECGAYGNGPEWLHSVSNEIHQRFLMEFGREPSKASADDINWLRQHIHNYDKFRADMVGYNTNIFENTVLPSLKRQYPTYFNENYDLARKAADDAYRTYTTLKHCQPAAGDRYLSQLFKATFTEMKNALDKQKAEEAAKEQQEQEAQQKNKDMNATFIAMHQAYFDKYKTEAVQAFNEAAKQFRREFRRKPTASDTDMAKMSEYFIAYMNAKGCTL